MPRRRSNEREAEVAAAGQRRRLAAAAITTHPREFVAIVMAIAATIAIFVNALFLQHGPHPAPIFATRPLMRSVIMPPKRAAAPAPLDSHGKLVANIQQALTAKGFYDGAIDGLWGAKTDSAVRDFLRASGSNAGVEASDTLLHAIQASAARANQTVAPPANDPIARLLKPSAASEAGTVPRQRQTSACSPSSTCSPSSATGRSSRPASSTRIPKSRSRNSSASMRWRRPAKCPTSWCRRSAPWPAIRWSDWSARGLSAT